MIDQKTDAKKLAVLYLKKGVLVNPPYNQKNPLEFAQYIE
jgi:hypothetical protein